MEQRRFDNRTLAGLIIPIVLEQFLVYLVGIVDTMMISYAGEAAVSGVSLVDQLTTVFTMIFTAIASGGAVVCSQYIGSRNREQGSNAAGQLVLITGAAGLFSGMLCYMFSSQIFGALFGKVEPAVYQAGVLYLSISACSYLFAALYNAGAAIFRSMGNSRIVMYISLLMNAVNVAGNAIGIFVLHAGVKGVAIPTMISRVLAAVLILILAASPNQYISVRIRDVFRFNGEMARKILGIALPGCLENGLFQFARVALSSICALFGTVQIAAYGIVQSFWSLSALFAIAMGPAFITVVGQDMGAGDTAAARDSMKRLLGITYKYGACWGVFFLILSPFILMLYHSSPETKHLVIMMVVMHSLFNMVLSPSAFSLSNGLRAAGDVGYTLFASLFTTIVVRVVFSLLLGVVFHLGVIGITIAMIIDWAVKAAMILTRFRGNRWEQFRVI